MSSDDWLAEGAEVRVAKKWGPVAAGTRVRIDGERTSKQTIAVIIIPDAGNKSGSYGTQGVESKTTRVFIPVELLEEAA